MERERRVVRTTESGVRANTRVGGALVLRDQEVEHALLALGQARCRFVRADTVVVRV